MKTREIKSMNKIKQVIIDILVIAILICIAIMICYNLYYHLAGFESTEYLFKNKKVVVVIAKDNLMSPGIKENEVVVFKKCNEENLKIGDIIYLEESNSKKISKIENIKTNDEGEKYYITKGENNYYYNVEKVKFRKIEGKFDKKINLLGKVLKIARTKMFSAIVVGIVIVSIIVSERNFWVSEDRRKKKERSFKKLNKLK